MPKWHQVAGCRARLQNVSKTRVHSSRFQSTGVDSLSRRKRIPVNEKRRKPRAINHLEESVTVGSIPAALGTVVALFSRTRTWRLSFDFSAVHHPRPTRPSSCGDYTSLRADPYTLPISCLSNRCICLYGVGCGCTRSQRGRHNY